MKALRKTWVRFLIALFGGGLINEIVFVSNGNPNRIRPENDNGLMLIYVVAIYLCLTWLVRENKDNKLN